MHAAQGAPQGRVTFGWIGEAWARFTAQAGTWVLATFIYGLIIIVVVYAIEMATILPIMFRNMPVPGAAAPNPSAMMRTMLPTFYLVGTFMGLVFVVLNAYLGGGLLKMANKAVRSYPIALSDLFSGGSSFLGLVMGQLTFSIPLYILSSAINYPIMERAYSLPATATTYDPFYQIKAMMPVYEVSLLLNLIPIVLLGLFWPAAAMIADGEKAFPALGKSWNAMKRSWPLAALLMLVVVIVTWISALPCLLGLLATVPMFAIISSLMYRDMVGMPAGDPPIMPGYYGQPPANPGVWPPPPGAYPPQPPEQGNPPS